VGPGHLPLLSFSSATAHQSFFEFCGGWGTDDRGWSGLSGPVTYDHRRSNFSFLVSSSAWVTVLSFKVVFAAVGEVPFLVDMDELRLVGVGLSCLLLGS